MSLFQPKFITFDCYGTLINFEMAPAATALYQDRVPAGKMRAFTDAFAAYRLDEVLGAWKPYEQVVDNAIRRACRRMGVEYREGDGKAIYDQVPTWGPHPDTSAGLAKVAKEFPLVGLTNAANVQIPHNIERIGVPFHAVYTAEQAQAYKPQMKAFEYLLGQLNCNPEDILHVSSSFRYDLMTAHDMGIKNKVWVNRGHEPANPYYGYTEIRDIGGLAAVVGL
ncbi:haloacid dehalogenase type II [Paraburkholderia silvatlantica]|uniref:2-haloacid dehalogenase n=1 Tax=Paraburkholderia silvatlantica TaxID=321895 RepID=A0ABR6FE82_9BURK|nr:haloacid dehalogenase type II [Paraburkholderia silvatlantica]MBB2925743.1 2-haloacid dehalogenase [Paraburkholderia silvatlantica]PVY33141.1 2-haloacid dehalogenase [Paraburkholderia silvatlantica]PXW38033.1 2-haloacid dehalogenase [Paraburkholderia silvatlantica]TDQ92562.1 2-haloacid dehalogenase [Paraburkholderia silvatlantica]